MTDEEAFQLALRVLAAGKAGEPMPEVAPEHEATARRLYQSGQRSLRREVASVLRATLDAA